MNSAGNNFVVKIPEPLISYEQVLLSQIHFCAKVSHEQYPLCVDNLISLLPIEIKEQVNERYDQILGIIRNHLKKLKLDCCNSLDLYDFCTCLQDDVTITKKEILENIKIETPALYTKYVHILPAVISNILNPTNQPISPWKLKFTIASELLIELGIIAPKPSLSYIGSAEG